MRDLTPHPLAEIFPRLDGADLTALADDIRKNGLRQAIVTCEGMVLDGRNRLAACKIAGVEPRFKEFTGDAPLGYVISLNLTRRHMDESQRATVAAKIATLSDGQRRVGKFADVPSQAQAAAMLNVSERSVRSARQVLEKGTPELISKVERGEVSVSKAAKTVQPPKPRYLDEAKLDEAINEIEPAPEPYICPADKYFAAQEAKLVPISGELATLRGAAEMRAAKGNASGAVMDVLKFTETPPSADDICELNGASASIGMVENRIRKIATPEIMMALAVTREAIANYIKRAA